MNSSSTFIDALAFIFRGRENCKCKAKYLSIYTSLLAYEFGCLYGSSRCEQCDQTAVLSDLHCRFAGIVLSAFAMCICCSEGNIVEADCQCGVNWKKRGPADSLPGNES